MNDLGVNLAGVEVILRLQSQLAERERRADETHARLEEELRTLRRLLAERARPRPQLVSGGTAGGSQEKERTR